MYLACSIRDPSTLGSPTRSQMAVFVCVLFSVVLISSTAAQISDEAHPVVETSKGPVIGLKFNSTWTNQTIYAFRGIPYAAPPVGDLRFRAPVEPAAWSVPLDCTEDRAKCPQAGMAGVGNDNDEIEATEDCLLVNVYSPQIPAVAGAVREGLPVMVWVHGGGFLVGSGNYASYGPDFLLAENVIVVTLNYRLGALGFMSLGTEGVPGNAGLRDQMEALRWVRKEISRFGGDPDKVTIFGESAGSASVHLLYTSPLPVGLFRGVIGESGAAMAEWAVRADGRGYGLQLASLLGCGTDPVSAAEACLRAAGTDKIVRAQLRVQSEPDETARGIQLAFIPTVDAKSSKDPFLPDSPSKLYEKGIGSKVPFLMGINKDEGLLSLATSTIDNVTSIRNNLEQFIPSQVRKSSSKAKIKGLVDKIAALYFKNPVSSYQNNVQGFVDLYTDICFGYWTAVSSRYYNTRNPVYLYYFSFNGTFKEDFSKYILNTFNITGISHAEELSYIFIRRKVNQTTTDDSDEMKTLRRMTRMWTNFAKYSTPTKGADPLLGNVMWSPVNDGSSRFLHINRTLEMSSDDFLANATRLWDAISGGTEPALASASMDDGVGALGKKSEL